MARLSKKKLLNLNELPPGWKTREELISAICRDPLLWESWDSLVKPGTMSMDPRRPEMHLMAHVFVFNSWQLTLFGKHLLSSTYKHWSMKNANNARVNGRILLNMGPIMRSPWHLQNSEIVVWMPEAHFELAMFDGDVHRFVDFNAPK